MNFKNILFQLNIIAQCQKYKLSLWQCPQFLFLIMGIIIISTAIGIYLIGNRYITEPESVALLVLVISAILFIITNIIIQSFERLAEVSRMKSEFIDIVSHQIRSPLTNLKWTIEILMSGDLGRIEKKQIEYFKALKENTIRMEDLVSDLLIVSRIEGAKLPLKKEEISLEDLIRKLISEFEIFAQASNVKIEFNSQKNLPKIFTDPSQIKLVTENLLDNAIKYIKNKGKVEINLQKKDKVIFFEIQDNGVGIPEKDKKYIFQKFFRSGNILEHQTNGSGLGLFIVKSIVKRLKGKVWFKSKEGKGTTFYFTLPIK